MMPEHSNKDHDAIAAALREVADHLEMRDQPDVVDSVRQQIASERPGQRRRHSWPSWPTWPSWPGWPSAMRPQLAAAAAIIAVVATLVAVVPPARHAVAGLLGLKGN